MKYVNLRDLGKRINEIVVVFIMWMVIVIKKKEITKRITVTTSFELML